MNSRMGLCGGQPTSVRMYSKSRAPGSVSVSSKSKSTPRTRNGRRIWSENAVHRPMIVVPAVRPAVLRRAATLTGGRRESSMSGSLFVDPPAWESGAPSAGPPGAHVGETVLERTDLTLVL